MRNNQTVTMRRSPSKHESFQLSSEFRAGFSVRVTAGVTTSNFSD